MHNLTAKDFLTVILSQGCIQTDSEKFKNEKKNDSWNKMKERGHLVKLVFQERKKGKKRGGGEKLLNRAEDSELQINLLQSPR